MLRESGPARSPGSGEKSTENLKEREELFSLQEPSEEPSKLEETRETPQDTSLYQDELAQELWPGAKVVAFEVRTGYRWEKAHTERGAEVASFLQRLNEVHAAEALDIDAYLALLEEADSKIDSLVTPEFVDDPVSIQADPEYAYIWNNTHKNVARSLAKKAETLSNDEKKQLNARLLDHMKSHFGRYPRDIEFDRQRDIFWSMESTWTGETADQIGQFYSEVVTEKTGKSDYSIWSLEYSRIETYGAHLQDFIIRSCTGVLDRDSTTDEDREGISRLVNSMMDDHVFGNLKNYVEVYEKLGPRYSVEPLLQNLRSENDTRRRVSAEILYRMELGKIVATEEGAEYLGKLYDLGKYNDPDFFVRRLNNSGLMAVLVEDGGSIEGVFPLELESQEDVVQSEVRQLMSEELFLPKADETPAQREQRERYLQLFLENYEDIFNDDFFEGTGVRLNSLDLHEQGWFLLTYLELSEKGVDETSGENPPKLEELKNFVSKYGEYGLKTFLALEYGGSAEDILEFASSSELTEDEKEAIFKNFYGIANEAFNWRGIFNQVEENVDHEFAPQVHEAFIRKNAEFFKAAQMIAKGEAEDITINELLKRMNTIAFSMYVLKGLHKADSSLELEQNPQHQGEYDSKGNLIENATSTYIMRDKQLGARVVVSIRPNPTVKKGKRAGGEARINFKVTDLESGDQARIAFDLSDYGEYIGKEDKPPVVSLDLGVGEPDREDGIWPSQRVGRVLGLVEGSEGGHNELSFKPETAEHFPEVAEQFRDYIKAKFVEEEA